MSSPQRLLELSREASWTFPSSFGNPVLGDEAWLGPLQARQSAIGEAVLRLPDGEAAELAANAWRLWMISRDLEGGRAFLEPVLGGGPTPHRARALYGDGLFAMRQGKRQESLARNEAALELAEDDAEALALAHLGLARVALDDGDHRRARELAVRAREHARGLTPALGQAPLHMHAQALRLAGDYDHAAALFEESLALNRRIGDPDMIAVELTNLGHVELHRGNVDQAERYFRELGPGDDAMSKLNEAALAFARGNRDRAQELVNEISQDESELAQDDRLELDHLRGALASLA